MSARKPLDPNCNGGLFCPVEGHVTGRSTGRGSRWSHAPLTRGQWKTLRERRREAQESPSVLTGR